MVAGQGSHGQRRGKVQSFQVWVTQSLKCWVKTAASSTVTLFSFQLLFVGSCSIMSQNTQKKICSLKGSVQMISFKYSIIPLEAGVDFDDMYQWVLLPAFRFSVLMRIMSDQTCLTAVFYSIPNFVLLNLCFFSSVDILCCQISSSFSFFPLC